MEPNEYERAMRKAAQIHFGTYPVVTFNQSQKQPAKSSKPRKGKDWTKIEAYRPDLKRRTH